MSAAAIAAEIESALREVARDVGNGAFTVTLTEPSTGPATPWDTATVTPGASYEVPAMIGSFARNMIDGTLIRATDKRVMIAGNTPEPLTSWTVTISGVSHAIVNVEPLAPSGQALMFEIQARD